jgi:N-acetylglucosaminyl-diphospho-decaprenol L-rhamnosyltransferase
MAHRTGLELVAGRRHKAGAGCPHQPPWRRFGLPADGGDVRVGATMPGTVDSPCIAGATSVVMVSYFTGPVLTLAIDAVLSQPGLCDLVVVDNGNPPEVMAELDARAAEDKRLVVITGHGNIGFAAGCNLGARRARGEFLLLLNPDCQLMPDTLMRLMAEGAGLAPRWMLGCRLENPDGSEQRGSRRAILTPWIAFVEAFRLDRLAPRHPYFQRFNRHDLPSPRATEEVPVISGACMFMPAEIYREVGGMDEGYFLHVEDIDLCYRMHVHGCTIYHVPDVRVVHFRSTSRAATLFIEWHKTRGFIRYFRKHFTGIYPPMFLGLVNACVLARFFGRALLIAPNAAIARLMPDRPGGSAMRSVPK